MSSILICILFKDNNGEKQIEVLGKIAQLKQIKAHLRLQYQINGNNYQFFHNGKLIGLSTILEPDESFKLYISATPRISILEKSFPKTDVDIPIDLLRFYTPSNVIDLYSSLSSLTGIVQNTSDILKIASDPVSPYLTSPSTPKAPTINSNKSHSSSSVSEASSTPSLLNSIFSRDFSISQISQRRYARAHSMEMDEEELILLDPQYSFKNLENDNVENSKKLKWSPESKEGPLQNLATEQVASIQASFGERLDNFTENFSEEDEEMIERLCRIGYDRQTCETFLFMLGGDRKKTERFMSRYTSAFLSNSPDINTFLEKLHIQDAEEL